MRLAGKPQGIFVEQHLAAFAIDFGFGQLAFAHRLPHDLQLSAKSTGHQQEVIASLQRLQAQTPGIAHAPHGQRIGEDQTFEAQFPAQQTGHNLPGERGRHAFLRLQGRHLQMPHHDASQARTDNSAEGIQLHAVQPFACERKDRQSLMRIHVRVAMSGEMLADGEHTPRLQAARVGHHLGGHLPRIFAKGAGVDDGISGIDVDICHGGKVDLHTYLAALAGHLAPVFV